MKFNFKIIVLILICLYTAITILFFSFYKSIAIKDIKQHASYVLNNMNQMRTYIKEYQRPAIYELLKHSKEEDYFDPTLLSANYMLNEVYKNNLIKNEIPYKYKLAATNPLNPIHKTTKFEEEILNQFRKDKNLTEYFDTIEEDGKSYFFMAKAIERNTKSCLLCHGDPNDAPSQLVERYGTESGFYENEDYLRAMIYVKVSVYNILKNHKEEFIWGGTAMFCVFIVIIILLYIISKKDKVLQLRKDRLFHHQNRLAVMGSMIGNISHQWKQPLTHLSNIFINLELQSERDKLTHNKLTNKITDANEQIKFMANTIDDFKDFFSPKDTTKHTNIEEIVTKSKNLWQASLNKFEIDLQINIEDNFIINAPRNEIVQIIINIISNAKDAFISNDIENRTIKINSFSKKNKNIVTIENNGGNIDYEVMNKIFKPYFSTKDLSVATGIGLYMSKVIMESYKGSISVNNNEDGVIFTLKFDKNSMFF